MTLEQLIADARAKRSPEEQARLDEEHRVRMKAVDDRLRREWKAQLVTQELLNKVIDL